MKQVRPKTNLQMSALALGGPVDQDAPKSYSPAILLLNCKVPRSASVAERLRLLEDFPAAQIRLQRIGCLPDANGNNRHRGSALADSLRRFIRKVPACDIVHCNVGEPETWTMLALGHVLIARFFGKAVVADLGFSINEESFEHPPFVLRMILGLSTVSVVTSELAVAMLSRRGVKAVQIPEALAPKEFTDRKVSSVQPHVLAVYSRGDRVAAEGAIKAFKLVKSKYPRAEMTMLVDSSDTSACRQLINERERAGIKITSAASTNEAASCYAEADMFVNTSVARGLRPMLKAMASGLPVVSAAGFYRDELIVDRRNGLTYRENDPGDLADRVIELIETPQLIHEITDRARSVVAEHAWSKISRRWLACYRSLQHSPSATSVARAGHQSHQPS